MAYNFSKEFFKKTITFREYISLTERLLSEGKTTGSDQSEKMVEYTKLNFKRMQRIEKTTTILPELKELICNLQQRQYWILIAEPWCGDAANTVPVIAKIAEMSDKISLGIILRDEYPEVMNEYLTNGGRSIPILILMNEEFKELGTWGPRPALLQNIVKEERAKPGYDSAELKKMIQMWYVNDKSVSIQREIVSLLKKIREQTDRMNS